MTDIPNCPSCGSSYCYTDRTLYICPECGHEWPQTVESSATDNDTGNNKITRDVNGTVLNDGDTVTVIKDLKVKGSSLIVKVGTKVKNIRLVNKDHDIDCKIPKIGPMALKSEFVKKVLD